MGINITNPWMIRKSHKVKNFFQKISAGVFGTKIKRVSRFGMNVAVGTEWETLYNVSNDLYYPSSGQKLKINSTSSEDAVGGSGVERVMVVGIDSNWDICS
jgi:hypothetical protein